MTGRKRTHKKNYLTPNKLEGKEEWGGRRKGNGKRKRKRRGKYKKKTIERNELTNQPRFLQQMM